MREILFKAKRIDNGEWVEGYYLQDKILNSKFIKDRTRHLIATLKKETQSETTKTVFYAIDPNTLSQYTGLKDKHGNKIWEHDGVLHTLANKEFSVIWENGLGFRLNRISDNCNEFFLTQRFCDEYAEVIGNKFDNPELLNGE